MSIPFGEVEIPRQVALLAGGERLAPVWVNGLGGITFRVGADRFIKWGPRNSETSFEAEAARMRWAGRFTRVPRVIAAGGDATHEWLVTAAVPGESAVSPRWLADPAIAVRAVGEGLRALHDALPAAECPFDWSVAARISGARARGIRAPRELAAPPPIDLLVVCHGDACCPNTLVGDDGRWSGHVDLGELGVADRWADLAVASMNTAWNYGAGWEDHLIEAYGLEPDRERLAYYRALWNAL